MTLTSRIAAVVVAGFVATCLVSATALARHAAVRSGGKNGTSVVQKGTLTVAVSTLGTETFVPRLDSGAELPVVFAWGETLVLMEPRFRKLTPDLATKWTLNKAENDWIWHWRLRKGVNFNERKGRVTASDVKFTFQQCLLPDSLNNGCPVLSSAIDGNINNFEIVNRYEFKLHSSQAVPNLPIFLSNGSTKPLPILPSAYYRKVGDSGFAAHPIGAGPFTFVSQVRGQGVTLQAVPKHFRQTPSFKTLRFVIAPDTSTRVAMLKSGAAQIGVLDTSQLPQIQPSGLKPVVIHNIGNLWVNLGGQFYDMPNKNCTSCPWVGSTQSALLVRRALSIAIDRSAIRRAIFLGSGQLSAVPMSWTPGPYDYNNPKWKVPTYDPAKAKALLAQAGYADGFTIGVPAVSGFPLLANIYDVAEVIAASWEAIGLKVVRTNVPWTSFRSNALANRNTAGSAFPIVTAKTDDPLADLARNFSKAGGVSYIDDRTFDQYIDRANDTVDPDKRAALARALGKYIIDNALQIPMFSLNAVLATTSSIKRYVPIAGNALFGDFEYVNFARR